MNKKTLVNKIVARLIAELEGYAKAARLAHAEATDEQSKAEHKYDTRGLEASYLAHGQVRQVIEMEAAIAALKNMEIRNFDEDEPVDVGALVELEHEGERSFFFIANKAGGMEVTQEKKEILVITPQSPLGEQIQGKKQGTLVQLSPGGILKQYRVAKVT